MGPPLDDGKLTAGGHVPKKPTVAEFLAALRHGRAEQVERLRGLILAAHPDLTEQIKWNAPSFSIDGDDRVTMRIAPGDLVQLILHRGAKVRDTSSFSFTDESGLVRWLAADRGAVTLADADDLEAKSPAIQQLVHSWVEATRG
jgi:hypothetical protein